jgi:hypothetical protein
MIDHVWSVVCGRSSTDRETNNISLFDVIEQLNVLGPLPEPAARVALPIPFEVVSLWSRSNPDLAIESRGRVKMIAPNGDQAFVQEFPINLNENPRMRTQLRSVGFPLLGTGRYIFTVEILRAGDIWETVARIPVRLDSVAQAAADGVVPGN